MLPHVPELNDFVSGLRVLLAPGGLLTMEFPHLLQLAARAVSSTRSTTSTSPTTPCSPSGRSLAAHGLRLVDVVESPTHGGSLRVFVRHESEDSPCRPRSIGCWRQEKAAGMDLRRDRQAFRGRRPGDAPPLVRLPPAAGAREGQEGGRLRRAGQGDDAPRTTARSAPNRIEVHGRPESGAAGRAPAGHGHPDPRLRQQLAATRPDYVGRSPWNLSGKDTPPQLRYVGRSWRPAGGARPPGRGAAVILESMPIGGACLDRAEPVEDERGLFARTSWRGASSRAIGLDPCVGTQPLQPPVRARCAGTHLEAPPTPRRSSRAGPGRDLRRDLDLRDDSPTLGRLLGRRARGLAAPGSTSGRVPHMASRRSSPETEVSDEMSCAYAPVAAVGGVRMGRSGVRHRAGRPT